MKTLQHRSISILLVLFLSYALNSHAQMSHVEYTKPDSNLVFMNKTDTGIIYNAKFNSDWYELKPGIKRFTPKLDLIESICSHLKEYIKDSNQYIYNYFVWYKKQFLGYIRTDGDTIIKIICNFGYDPTNPDYWKHDLKYLVYNSDSEFELIYNLTTRKYYLDFYLFHKIPIPGKG